MFRMFLALRSAPALVLGLALAATPKEDAAPAACEGRLSLRPDFGTLWEGPECGEYLLGSGSSPAGFSMGSAEIELPDLNAEDYVIEMRMQRLSPDTRYSVEIALPGGAVMLRRGEVAVWESGVAWSAGDGWTDLVGLDTSREFRLRVESRRRAGGKRDLRIFVDGTVALRYATRDRVGKRGHKVTLKAPLGREGRVRVRDIRYELL